MSWFAVLAAWPPPPRSKPMNELLVITLLVVSIFAFLGCGVWVGLTLAGTAWIGM